MKECNAELTETIIGCGIELHRTQVYWKTLKAIAGKESTRLRWIFVRFQGAAAGA